MLTVQNVYDAFARYKQDIDDVGEAEFIEWTNFTARFIYDKVKRVDPERYVNTQLYTVVLDPQTESLPTDLKDLRQTACGLYFYDTRKRSVVTFDSTGDSDVTFSDSGGTSAYNTNIKVQGNSSRGYTGDAAATLMLSFGTAINWEDFDDDGPDSPNNDYISIWVYVGNSVPTSATIEFSTSSDGSDVGVEQFSYTDSSLSAGWNQIKVLKSAFTETGSPDWGSLSYLRLIYTGGDTTTNVYWDKLELVESEVNGNDETQDKLALLGYGNKKEGYYFNKSNIVFTGITDKDYVMRYIPSLTKFTALTNSISVDGTATGAAIVDDEDLEYLVKAVDVLYEQWDVDPSKESLADFRFVRALGDTIDGHSRTPQIAQSYDFTNDF